MRTRLFIRRSRIARAAIRDPFPPLRLNVRCVIRHGTFAETNAMGEMRRKRPLGCARFGWLKWPNVNCYGGSSDAPRDQGMPARQRLCFSRLPQFSMLHHRRRCALLVSIK